ncbi:organic hydroperoxide resistance protein [Paenibacillus gansuensis]|uniref:Organic hydroperoxide resistance protein n=1 Tax=Paenibacillus gansuensis TaxID=306542 RepID=A0ABW5PFY2_9BACL
MNALYTATATAVGGREGNAASDDGKLNVKLGMPKELGGSGGEGTNPEQLFAAGYAACFESALALVAQRQGMKISGTQVTAQVSLYKNGEAFKLGAELNVYIPNVDAAKTEELAHAAHQVCPYSRATEGNIDVTIRASEQRSVSF